MATITPEMLTLLLSNCIKQFGTENTLRLEDQQLGNPSLISLHPGAGYAILVLLEGQTQLDQWDKTRKKMEDKDVEISEREGEPEPEDE